MRVRRCLDESYLYNTRCATWKGGRGWRRQHDAEGYRWAVELLQQTRKEETGPCIRRSVAVGPWSLTAHHAEERARAHCYILVPGSVMRSARPAMRQCLETVASEVIEEAGVDSVCLHAERKLSMYPLSDAWTGWDAALWGRRGSVHVCARWRLAPSSRRKRGS